MVGPFEIITDGKLFLRAFLSVLCFCTKRYETLLENAGRVDREFTKSPSLWKTIEGAEVCRPGRSNRPNKARLHTGCELRAAGLLRRRRWRWRARSRVSMACEGQKGRSGIRHNDEVAVGYALPDGETCPALPRDGLAIAYL